MTTLNYTNTLSVVNCCKCFIDFAMPAEFVARRKNDHETWYCPAGHAQSWTGKSDADKLKDEQAARFAAERAQREAEDAAAKAQAKLSKLKHRVDRGVCPHCTRTFKNMAKHIACKHPGVLK